MASVAWLVRLQSDDEVCFSCAANSGAAFANICGRYLGIKQFTRAKINSGKSCKPDFFFLLFSCKCLTQPLVIYPSPLYGCAAIQAQVRIHESVSNSVSSLVDFYSSDTETQAFELESCKGAPPPSYTQLRWTRGFFFGDAAATLLLVPKFCWCASRLISCAQVGNSF